MDPVQISFILKILKLVCPELKRMAKESVNPVDDIVVGVICALAAVDIPPEILQKGGDYHG